MISEATARELAEALRETFPHVRITAGTEDRAIGWGILAIAAERIAGLPNTDHIQRCGIIADCIAEYVGKVQRSWDEVLMQFLDREYGSPGLVTVSFSRDADPRPYEAVIKHAGPHREGFPGSTSREWGEGDTPSAALRNVIEQWEGREV